MRNTVNENSDWTDAVRGEFIEQGLDFGNVIMNATIVPAQSGSSGAGLWELR